MQLFPDTDIEGMSPENVVGAAMALSADIAVRTSSHEPRVLLGVDEKTGFLRGAIMVLYPGDGIASVAPCCAWPGETSIRPLGQASLEVSHGPLILGSSIGVVREARMLLTNNWNRVLALTLTEPGP